MTISIVIPTCNHLEDCLKPCIESFREYIKGRSIEVIIVANGCKDQTREYVESLGSQYRLLWFDDMIGAPKAYNEGVFASTGDFILLLNDDVVMLQDNWLNLLMTPFSDSDVGLTGVVKFTLDIGAKTKEAFALWCVMVRREVFSRIGYFDEIFYPFGCEDIDFCIRAANDGWKLIQVPENTSNKFLVEKPKGEKFPIYHAGSKTVDEYYNHNVEKKKMLENRNLNIVRERYS